MKDIKEMIQGETTSIDPKEWCEIKSRNYNESTGSLKGYECEVCKNKGYIQVVRFVPMYNDYECFMRECQCMKKRRLIAKAERNGLGGYIHKTMNDFICENEWQELIKNKACDYLNANDDSWFIMCGQSGAGKTLICSIISNELLINQEREVIYASWTDFISKLKRDMMGDNSNAVSEYLDEIKAIDVLYIDELLKKFNDTDLKYIIEIINYRYTNNLKTIISSERTIDDLLNIDEATFGRVIEKAGKYVTNIPKDRNKNYRLKGIM